MTAKLIQGDLFAKDNTDLLRLIEEETKRCKDKKLRFAFHFLSDLNKEIKNPASGEAGAHENQ